jgi:hypothetical protein
MKFIDRWAALVASAAFFLASPVSAQWQVPSGAFPLGKGSGTGFAFILCTQAQIAIGQNAAAPICAALSGDITMTAGGVTAIGASKVTNSMLATMAANTTKCNATAGTTNPTDCTASTMRTNIGVVIGTNVQAWDTDLDCIAALSSTGQIKRTGTGTCSAGSVAVSDLATGTQDTVIGYFGSTTASALAINNCTGALTYSTSTHTFGCNVTAGTGTVTSAVIAAGNGISGIGHLHHHDQRHLHGHAARSDDPEVPGGHERNVHDAGRCHRHQDHADRRRCRIIGGGNSPGTPTVGNPTCWNTSGAACTTPVYQAGGGGLPASNANGGTGGTVSGSGTCDWSVDGSDGTSVFSGTNAPPGAASSLGAVARGGYSSSQAGQNGKANSGGSGGAGYNGGGGQTGSVGGAGATCVKIISSPAATYTYAVAATANGGTAGTGGGAGGNGAGGLIIVEEY